MTLCCLILPLLAFAAPAVSSSTPVIVTGHAWAPFISPMGEPYRARSTGDDALATWYARADRNHDGTLTADEMVADADRFFALLDSDHDGEIDPVELNQYEVEVAPEIQTAIRTMRLPGGAKPKRREGIDDMLGLTGALQGAARYALLNIPEPVAAADTDFDRGVSLAEFRLAAARRFQLLDSGRTGKLTLAQLETIRTAQLASGNRGKNADDARVGNGLPQGD
jgi:Ca2+-binding EF-hand superfamily protein